MNEKITFFSQIEGNLLIRLLLAHFVADFLLQTKKMVEQKNWFSRQMLLHIAIVFGMTGILSWNLYLALTIAMSHWLIDAVKVEIKKRGKKSETILFIVDQVVHIIFTVLLWAFFSQNFSALWQSIKMPFINYKSSLIILGYIFNVTLVGYIIQYVTQGMTKTNDNQKQEESNASDIKDGGKLIGIFERIIILTFVLLGQYQAIGFLITGKSIIRFANNDQHLRSEYVLVGTMMSYALAILTGAGINFLLKL